MENYSERILLKYYIIVNMHRIVYLNNITILNQNATRFLYSDYNFMFLNNFHDSKHLIFFKFYLRRTYIEDRELVHCVNLYKFELVCICNCKTQNQYSRGWHATLIQWYLLCENCTFYNSYSIGGVKINLFIFKCLLQNLNRIRQPGRKAGIPRLARQ